MTTATATYMDLDQMHYEYGKSLMEQINAEDDTTINIIGDDVHKNHMIGDGGGGGDSKVSKDQLKGLIEIERFLNITKNNTSAMNETKTIDEERRRKNRESAAKCRLRLRQRIIDREKRVKELKNKRDALKNELTLLEIQIQSQSEEINKHKLTCNYGNDINNNINNFYNNNNNNNIFTTTTTNNNNNIGIAGGSGVGYVIEIDLPLFDDNFDGIIGAAIVGDNNINNNNGIDDDDGYGDTDYNNNNHKVFVRAVFDLEVVADK
ncbi:myb-like protein D [Oppia nitens]|uniref:myb-like protein D n=1 Tax=Oppia nitens TaxID=1686743 RepID=UPI0023DCCEDD|nr:myb-like protein D [Oppia nitens]